MNSNNKRDTIPQQPASAEHQHVRSIGAQTPAERTDSFASRSTVPEDSGEYDITSELLQQLDLASLPKSLPSNLGDNLFGFGEDELSLAPVRELSENPSMIKEYNRQSQHSTEHSSHRPTQHSSHRSTRHSSLTSESPNAPTPLPRTRNSQSMNFPTVRENSTTLTDHTFVDESTPKPVTPPKPAPRQYVGRAPSLSQHSPGAQATGGNTGYLPQQQGVAPAQPHLQNNPQQPVYGYAYVPVVQHPQSAGVPWQPVAHQLVYNNPAMFPMQQQVEGQSALQPQNPTAQVPNQPPQVASNPPQAAGGPAQAPYIQADTTASHAKSSSSEVNTVQTKVDLRVDINRANETRAQQTNQPTSLGAELANEAQWQENMRQSMPAVPTYSANPSVNSAMAEEEAMKQFRLFFQKASLKEKAENLEDALEDYNMALYFEIQGRGETNLEIAKTHRVIGRVCRRANKSRQAVEHLEQALAICTSCGFDSSDSDMLWTTHDELAQSYSQVNADKEVEHYGRAIDILTKATDIPPERLAHMHNNLGVCYHKKKEFNKAKEHLLKAKEMMTVIHTGTKNEDMAKVHKSLGDLYQELKFNSLAIDEFTACIKIHANNPQAGVGRILSVPAHTALADIYEHNGQAEKAREHRLLSEWNVDGLKDEDHAALEELASKVTGAGGLMTLAKSAHDNINKAQNYQKENDHQNAIVYYEKAIEDVKKLSNDGRLKEDVLSQLAMLHNNVGNAYRSVSRLQDGKDHLVKALELRRQLYADEACDATATTLFNLGHIYTQIGGIENQVQAIDTHKECLEMYMKLGGAKNHMRWVVGLHRSLASTYYNLGEAAESIKYYEKAKIVINDFGGDLSQLQAVCNNVGNSYKSIKDYANAEENLQNALNLATIMSDENPENLELQNDIAAAHNNLGCMYQEKGSHQKAIEHHKISLAIRERISPLYAEAATDLPSSLHNIGNAYMSAHEYNDAMKYYEREEKVRSDLGEDIREVLMSMSRLHEKKGDLAMAEHYVNRAQQLG